MIKTEPYMLRDDGIRLIRTYSDSGFMIERDGILYEDAIDPENMNRVYTETDIKNPGADLSPEEALSIITGGEI